MNLDPRESRIHILLLNTGSLSLSLSLSISLSLSLSLLFPKQTSRRRQEEMNSGQSPGLAD